MPKLDTTDDGLRTEFNPALKIDQLNENCEIVMLFVYFGDKKLKQDEICSFLCCCANCGVRLANDSFLP